MDKIFPAQAVDAKAEQNVDVIKKEINQLLYMGDGEGALKLGEENGINKDDIKASGLKQIEDFLKRYDAMLGDRIPIKRTEMLKVGLGITDEELKPISERIIQENALEGNLPWVEKVSQACNLPEPNYNSPEYIPGIKSFIINNIGWRMDIGIENLMKILIAKKDKLPTAVFNDEEVLTHVRTMIEIHKKEGGLNSNTMSLIKQIFDRV